MNTFPLKLRVACAILTMALVASNTLSASGRSEGNKSNQESSGGTTVDPSANDKGYPLATANPEPLGDYVPCMFDLRELFALRSLAPPKDGLRSAISEATNKDPEHAAEFAHLLSQNPPSAKDPLEAYAQYYKLAIQAKINSVQAVQIAASAAESVAAAAFSRPVDIGCAMTVYGWKEAADNFGRRVADNFIAIQITVRNLNPNLEFLLHDAELAADANMAGLSRFQSSHERRVVRNVGQVGQVLDARNMTVRIMEGIGMIAGSATGFAPSGYALGYSVYTAGVIPAFKHVFPDMTQDQLNNISDMAFTSSWSSRIVVPKSGAVSFVTYIPSSPLEQACWLQPTYDVRQDTTYGAPLNACPDSKTGSGPSSGSGSDSWKTIPYKKWNAIQQQALVKHAYAVIAGVHIQEVHKAAVKNVDCPPLEDGTVDLSKAQNGVYSCAITGSDLDSVSSVTLTQAASTVNGIKWIPSTDKKSAQAQFAESDLSGLSGDYKLNLIYASGESVDSGQALKFKVRSPSVTDVSFDTTDLSKAKTGVITMTIQGSDLDRILSVKLTSDGEAEYTGVVAAGIKQSDTSGTVTFKTAQLAGAVNEPLSLTYTAKDNPNNPVKVSSKSLPVSFTNSAKVAAPKPAQKPSAPTKGNSTQKNKPAVKQ